MQEIRVGQTWRENVPPHRELRVTAVDGDQVAVEYTRRDHGGTFFSGPWLQRLWTMVEPAPVRRIVLALAADTTEKECGACPFRGEHCQVFQRRVEVWSPTLGHDEYKRLDECIAAEVR